MTSERVLCRRQPIVAIASLSAGLLATALAVYTQSDAYAFTTGPSVAAGGDVSTERPAAEASSSFLPRVTGTAVPEVAELDLPSGQVIG